MINFKLYYEQVNSNAETVAVLPGGFKPPTKGHFQVLLRMLENADRAVIFIGKSPRDNISQEMSNKIWNIYKSYINKPVDIVSSPITPVKSTYDFAIENPNSNILVGVGSKDDDKSRYNSFIKNKEKYPHVAIKEIEIQGDGISGTKTRELIMAGDPNAINYCVPDQLKETDRDLIKSILGIA